MSESEPGENPDASSVTPRSSRQRALTPEQRRFLGTPRASDPESKERGKDEPKSSGPIPVVSKREENFAGARKDLPEERRRPAANAGEQAKASRAVEMRHALALIGALVVLVLIFFAGRKFDRLKYMVMAGQNAPKLPGAAEKFPGMTAEELVESALAAEKLGNWKDAADRFIEAKRKDFDYRGILFRIGKTCFDRSDLAGADTALSHAIEFGEDVAVANYLRGIMAVRRHDLAAAERFFEAAVKAQPFMSDFYYFWGEALRLNQKPGDAIRRYQQAIQRSASGSDVTLCRFKIRLARLEAVEGPKLSEEIEAQRQAGPLSCDWIMTDAAVQLQSGRIAAAAQLIAQAREQGPAGSFAACAGDSIFLQAGEKHPEILAAIQLITPPPLQPERLPVAP